MIINHPSMCTHIPVWEPRYHDKVALPQKRKVDQASPVIIFEFPKSNAYRDGRYCMTRQKAQTYPVEVKQGKTGPYDVYAIPVGDFEPWDSGAEVVSIANNLFPD